MKETQMYYLKQIIYNEGSTITDVSNRIHHNQSNLSIMMIKQCEKVSKVHDILEALNLEGEFVFALNEKEISELQKHWIRPGMDLSKRLNCIGDLLMHGYTFQDLETEGIETAIYLSKAVNVKDNMKVENLKRIAKKTGRELYIRYRKKGQKDAAIKLLLVNIDVEQSNVPVIKKVNENYVNILIKRLLTRHMPVKELITKLGVSSAGFHRLFPSNVMTTSKAEEMLSIIGYETEFLIVAPDKVEDLKKVSLTHQKPAKRLQCLLDIISEGVKKTEIQRMTNTSPGRVYKILLADDTKIDYLSIIAENLGRILVMRYWNTDTLTEKTAKIEVIRGIC